MRLGVKRSRSRSVALVLVLAGASVAACSSTSTSVPAGGEAGPEARCKTPDALPAGAWFTDVTAESGLADVEGIRISSADLDGDGLPDLIVHRTGTERDSPDAPMKRVFLNRGGRFEETTAESGLFDSRQGTGTGRLAHMAIFADVDNDGDLDLFSGTYADANTEREAKRNDRSEIFLNDGSGHFTLAPRSETSTKALPTSSASFADYDRDGIVDLFLGTFYSGNEGAGTRLFRGVGEGLFTDVSEASKVLRPSTNGALEAYLRGENRKPAYGVTTCDVDDDGDADLVVSAYGRSWNELWRNDDGVFTEVGFGTPFAADDDVDYTRGNEFFNCWCSENEEQCTEEQTQPSIGCDRYSWTPGFDDQPARNAGNTFTTACADLDDDGDMDFVHSEIRHWHIGTSSDASQIVRNDLANGELSFTRLPNDETTLLRPPTIAAWNEGDISVAAFDVDNDGRKDIYLASSDYPDTWGSLFHQQPDGTFRNVTDTAGAKHYHAVAFAAVDIDGDGDLDLVVATSGMRCGGDRKCPPKPTLKVYRNDIGASRNFTQLRLHGKGKGFSNAAAIGAKVTIFAGGKKQVQEVSGGYGHFGLQHDLVLTFGLDAACAIDAIEVRWPDAAGTVQRFENVAPNYLVDLFEGEAEPTYVR
jgi:enediyne biosynthesis protein E4